MGENQSTQSQDTISKASKTSTLPGMMPRNRGAAGCDRDEDADDNEGEDSEYTNVDPYQGHPADIRLCPSTGESVIWQDVKWERNPHADADQDSLKLLVIVPGHHPLQANITAVDFCASLQTNIYSQFYILDPTLHRDTHQLGNVRRDQPPASNPWRKNRKR